MEKRNIIMPTKKYTVTLEFEFTGNDLKVGKKQEQYMDVLMQSIPQNIRPIITKKGVEMNKSMNNVATKFEEKVVNVFARVGDIEKVK